MRDRSGRETPGRAGDPKIIREPAFVRLMLASMVVNERWDDVRSLGYSDEEIHAAIKLIADRIPAAPVAPAEKKKSPRPRRALKTGR